MELNLVQIVKWALIGWGVICILALFNDVKRIRDAVESMANEER